MVVWVLGLLAPAASVVVLGEGEPQLCAAARGALHRTSTRCVTMSPFPMVPGQWDAAQTWLHRQSPGEKLDACTSDTCARLWGLATEGDRVLYVPASKDVTKPRTLVGVETASGARMTWQVPASVGSDAKAEWDRALAQAAVWTRVPLRPVKKGKALRLPPPVAEPGVPTPLTRKEWSANGAIRVPNAVTPGEPLEVGWDLRTPTVGVPNAPHLAMMSQGRGAHYCVTDHGVVPGVRNCEPAPVKGHLRPPTTANMAGVYEVVFGVGWPNATILVLPSPAVAVAVASPVPVTGNPVLQGWVRCGPGGTQQVKVTYALSVPGKAPLANQEHTWGRGACGQRLPDILWNLRRWASLT